MTLFFMFLAAMDFFARFFVWVYLAALAFMCLPNRKLHIDFSILCLMVLSLSFLVFDPISQDRLLDMLKPFTYPICYLIGSSLYIGNRDEKFVLANGEKRVSNVIYVLAGGTAVHYVLNMIINWGAETRIVVDYWTKVEISATSQATICCFLLAVAIAFLFTKVGKKKKIIAVAALVLIISYNLILAGRTIFALMIIMAVVVYLYTRWVNKEKLLKTVIIAVVIFLLLSLLYNANAFGIKSAFESSNFYTRFYGGTYTQEIDDDKRLDYKLQYLEHFLDYPWGGENINELVGHHAHDLYLDTYDEASVFAFLAVVAYILMSLIRMVKCIKNDRLTVATRTLVLCIYLSCNIIFWLEPILRGMPWLFSAYCFMDGAVTALLAQMEDMQHSDTYLSISKTI